jgi:hypothetical protein|tara:strand:+ start:1180 stop:1290 length:111 start_codon:yes stop_codon:yes gene_type:complete
MQSDEKFEIVDEAGNVTGTALRTVTTAAQLEVEMSV